MDQGMSRLSSVKLSIDGKRRMYAGPAAVARRSRLTSKLSGETAIAARGALEQELALACVAGERRGALELRAGLVEAAELHEQSAADARQEVGALERRLRHEPVDDLESGDRSKGHRDGDAAIQLDDRGGCELGEPGIQCGDADPVG